MHSAHRHPLIAVLLIAIAIPVFGQSAPSSYIIGPPDVLQINVFDQPDLGGHFTVEADGTINFPLVGRIKAGGLNVRQFEDELKKRLADGFLRNPQLTVGVEQFRSQRIFILGEVRSPGTYALTGQMRFIEALARAGSALPSASGEALVVRAKSPQAVTGPILPGQDNAAAAEVITVNLREVQTGALSQNIELHDGDTIFLPQAESIYVFGEVKNPGSYGIRPGTSILQALSLAGGTTQFAALNRIKIVRMVGGKRKELKVGLADFVKPGDTIIVPQRFF